MTNSQTNTLKTEPARYSADDFMVWQENQMLELTPKFQRRGVWKTPAQAYLIDTILRGMTIPPLYIRMTQNESRTKLVRQVVDGQQRVRAVLEFIGDSFRLSKTLMGPWAGKKFSQLSKDEQNSIVNYSFSFEIFKGISDQEVLEVFCRLNMNGIPLNKQELRNGKYFGVFKQACYKLSLVYLEFWRRHKIFTEQNIARMLEVELTSELVIAGMSGMQDKKKSIDEFYEEREDSYPSMKIDKQRFENVMEELSESFPGGLGGSVFRRPPLFYTLYCVVFHRRFGLPGIQRQSPKKKLTLSERDGLREAVEKLSDIFANLKSDKTYSPPKKYAHFISATTRQTDNIIPRKARFDSLYDEAF